MAATSIRDTRGAQMFPSLGAAEVERLRRFGKVRHYAAGEPLARVGQAGIGMSIILSGKVDISQAGYLAATPAAAPLPAQPAPTLEIV